MQLNDDHIELLTRVRDRMYQDFDDGSYLDREYICWNIHFIHNGIEVLPRGKLFDDEFMAGDHNVVVRELVKAVEGALDTRNYTFSGWLSDVIDENQINLDWRFSYQLGRLAWLDRMIETRVIA